MKLKIQQEVTKSNPKCVYRIKVDTMTGDADGYNDFNIDLPDSITGRVELKNVIIYCEVLAKQYRNGRGGGTGYYDHLDFFDEWFEEEWYYEEGEYMDDFEDYSIFYFDLDGKEFNVSAYLSEQDMKDVDSYEVKQ